MNIKRKFLKNNITNLINYSFHNWTPKTIKYILFLIQKKEYYEYNDLLKLIFDEFIFYIKNSDNIHNIDIDHLISLRENFNDTEIDLVDYYQDLEKQKAKKILKENEELKKKFDKEINCRESYSNFNLFDDVLIDIFDFKFIGFYFAFFVIIIFYFFKSLFSFRSNIRPNINPSFETKFDLNQDKKNMFHFKIPLDDNIFINSIIKYFFGEKFTE